MLFAFFGVVAAAFLALGAAAAFFFCTAPAVLAGPLVTRPEAVLAETVVSLTMAGAFLQVQLVQIDLLVVLLTDGGAEEGMEVWREVREKKLRLRTIAGVFFTRLVDVLAVAALAFVVLAAEAFFGAALAVVGFPSVFLGRPAVLVPAGFAALVAF